MYVNGEKRAETDSRCKSWDGTLFVGAERTLAGEAFRFSTQKVRSLFVTQVLPSEEEIAEDSRQDLDARYFVK